MKIKKNRLGWRTSLEAELDKTKKPHMSDSHKKFKSIDQSNVLGLNSTHNMVEPYAIVRLPSTVKRHIVIVI